MTTKVTRREAAKIAAAGALIPSAMVTTLEGATGTTTDKTMVAEVNTPRTETGSAPNDPSAAMQRAAVLLRRMTIEEKAMQVSCGFRCKP